jgi:hypothetical protein
MQNRGIACRPSARAAERIWIESIASKVKHSLNARWVNLTIQIAVVQTSTLEAAVMIHITINFHLDCYNKITSKHIGALKRAFWDHKRWFIWS